MLRVLRRVARFWVYNENSKSNQYWLLLRDQKCDHPTSQLWSQHNMDFVGITQGLELGQSWYF